MSMNNYRIFSDKELIASLREGDSLAYTEVYNRYFHLMLVFAYKKLRDEDLAKDFVQDLFTQVWVRRLDILVEGNLLQYLYISIRSKVLNYFCHQKVQEKYLDSLADFDSTYAPEQSDFYIREKQLADYIETQIKRLPSKMRRVFEMSRKEHLSHREIAHTLNTSESNVSHHINNAVKILRTKINTLFVFFFL
ncbi:MAG: RNA polymerase sigma-70 factor [Chryseobacterium sp.]|nr:MAG: RNA polymerase sigma-70 factor [Chryseobacterium sp.]